MYDKILGRQIINFANILGPFIGKRVHVMTSYDGYHWIHTEPEVAMDPDKVTVPIDQENQR